VLGLVREFGSTWWFGLDSIWFSGNTLPDDIHNSLALMTGLLSDINKAAKQRELQHAVAELKRLVTDWRNEKVESFGHLLLFDDLAVVSGKNNRERRVRVIPSL